MKYCTDSLDSPDTSEGDINLSQYRSLWQNRYIDEQTRNWLDKDERYFLHQSLSTPCLNILSGALGSEIKDIQGGSFLDFHGNSVHQVGFGNFAVIEAIKKQIDMLSFCPRRYSNIPAIELAEKLVQITPGDLTRVLFAPGGTTAVGMALKLARAATGRFKTISMWGSFHGASIDAISVGGESLFRKGAGPLLTGTEHVPPADPYNCIFNSDGNCDSCDLKCAKYIEYILEQEGDIAAVIAEPIRCTSVNLPPKGYWRAVRKACDRYNALLIFDETAVCLGRTGRMFACNNYDVVPDILILGKGLGGGIFPLAAMVAREHLNIAGDKALGHYTHEKNPVACAAGFAAIGFIEKEGLVERSEELGYYALNLLKKMASENSLIDNVRGIGLLFGLELMKKNADGKKIRATDEAEQVLYASLNRGLSFKISQGNFITLTPPLTILRSDIEKAINIISESLREVEINHSIDFKKIVKEL
ncbi:MAG: aspartate aminotransferase family protein [Desulfamplus sp.]|nr:aspartate aminotransferase family protein [Desulfamplus sp.]